MKRGERFALLFAVVLVLVAFTSRAFGGSAMVDKNLFAPDRKPPSPETMEAPPQRNQPGLSIKAIQLDGVIIHGNTKKALIRYKGKVPGSNAKKGDSPYSTVQEGEQVGDYKVVRIDNKSITLEKDGKTEEMSLFAEGKVVPPAPRLPAVPAVNNPQDANAQGRAKGNMAPGGQPPPGMQGNVPGNAIPRPGNPNVGVPQPPGGQALEEEQQTNDEDMSSDEVDDGSDGSDGDGQ